MSSNQEALKLRFSAGGLESTLIYLILILQTVLVAMSCVATFWTIHMTIGAYLDPNEPILMYADWLLYPLGGIFIVFILNLLYE